jgi:hypothetical protein
MATRKESELARTQALDDLDEVTADDEVEEAPGGSDAPAEGETEATPQPRTEAPAEGGEAELPEEEVPPAPQQHPEAWQPPAGGEPLRFRADSREVEVPGGLRYDHGVYVPTEAWDRVVQRHLADREAIQEHWTGQLRQIESALEDGSHPAIQNHPAIIQAGETLTAFENLMAQGPEAVARWLDNYSVNKPLLEQQIQNRTLTAQLAAQRTQVNQSQQQQAVDTVAQQLPGYVRGNIEALITQTPELAGLKGSEQKLLERFYPVAKSFLYEDGEGRINTNWDVLLHLLRGEADRQAEVKRLQAAAKHNRRAVGGNGTSPRTVPARGRAVPAGRAQTFKPGESQKAKDAFLDWDPLAED